MSEQAVVELRGEVVMWQTDNETGEEVPGTRRVEHNTIGDDLKAYLAYSMAAHATDQALDTLLTSDAYSAGKDGIAYRASGSSYFSHYFDTDLNDGGDNSETYVEFYGKIGGAVTLNGTLALGFSLSGTSSTAVFDKEYATYTINETVPASRSFHFYWKITMS